MIVKKSDLSGKSKYTSIDASVFNSFNLNGASYNDYSDACQQQGLTPAPEGMYDMNRDKLRNAEAASPETLIEKLRGEIDRTDTGMKI